MNHENTCAVLGPTKLKLDHTIRQLIHHVHTTERVLHTYGTMPTTTTVDVETTVVSTETTQTTFDCSIWHYRFGHWYLLDSNYRTFNDSRTFCASLSPPAYVVEVQSQADNDWLSELNGTMPTTTTVNVETTVVSTETTHTTFDCSIWHFRFGHLYLLDSNYRTFNDSRTFCSSLSPPAYVIEVQSQAENDWLLELTSTNCGVAYEYWLNGYDTDNSGTFTWINGQTPSTYTNWYTGQPDDYYGIGSEKCIASSTGHGGVWNDIPCTGTRPVVCERNI
uniref:Lectin n=1 Tax=Magallana gigas TaxID=29159 RepID=K1RFN4_MAGGI